MSARSGGVSSTNAGYAPLHEEFDADVSRHEGDGSSSVDADFRSAFEALPGNFLLLSTDFTMIGASDARLRATHTKREQIVGRKLFEVFPDNPDDLSADGASNLRASLDRVLARRAVDVMPVQKYDIRRPDAEGGGFEERYWSPVNVPVIGADGEVEYLIHIVEDVTAAVQLRGSSDQLAREVQHHADLTRLVIQRAHSAFISMDTRGLIIEWNPSAERIFGWRRDEVMGRLVSDVMIPERYRARHREGLFRFLGTGEGPVLDNTVEIEAMHRDGHEFAIALTISPIVLDGEHTFHAFIQDVSERRRHEADRERHVVELAQANAQLAMADQLKDQFLAMASHEMRTPLTAIAGFATTMQNMWVELKDEQKREFVGIIGEQTARLQRLVDDLLTLARIESGGLEARAEEITVAKALEQTVRELGVEDVRVECSEQLTARADPDQLQQILTNYLGNAVKYGAEPFALSARRVENNVEIRVADQGMGVPAEFVPSLFERFSRATSTSSIPGTGLGLSITRGLARAQGGDTWYEPNQPRGACFVVELPGSGAPAHSGIANATTTKRREAREAADADAAQATMTRACRIAICDDVDAYRMLLATICHGAEGLIVVGEATNGQQAIDLVTEMQVDVLLLDVSMPQMDGIEALPLLRVQSPDTSVMMLTGFDTDELRERAMAAGARAFLRKGLPPNEIIAAIRNVWAES